jgi:hypothetical protein
MLFFIAGLVLSGVTAFPLLRELDILAALAGPATADGHGLAWWIQRVHLALSEQHRLHPFLAYGTDWLGLDTWSSRCSLSAPIAIPFGMLG